MKKITMKWRMPHYRMVIISLVLLPYGCDKSVGVTENSKNAKETVPAELQVISGNEQKSAHRDTTWRASRGKDRLLNYCVIEVAGAGILKEIRIFNILHVF